MTGIGSRVLVSEPDGMQFGTAVGIDSDFRLIVRLEDGTDTALDRGDVTLM